jgi:hypothetical protein
MSAAVFHRLLASASAFPATSRGGVPAKTWRTSRAGNGVIVQSNGNRNCCAVSVDSRVVRQEPEGRQVASEGDHTSHMHWTDRTGSGIRCRHARRVPLTDAAVTAFKAFGEQALYGIVFSAPSLRKRLHLACSKLQVPPIRPHDLRHTFASWLVNE